MRGELIWKSRQSGVLSQGIDGRRAKIIDLIKAAISPTNGIYERGAKSVSLLQADDLAPGIRVDQYRVEAIGRAIRCDVPQVDSVEVVLTRNLVITPDCEEVLGDDPLTGEAGRCRIAVCAVGMFVETGQKPRYFAD